jgi:hypothetical protein
VTPAAGRGRGRCYIVYALAPDGTPARAANDRLNEYVSDPSRGVPVSHDHFVEAPHGGFAVFHVRTAGERARLDDPGPLEGWQIRSHPLVYALTPVGFARLVDFSLEVYGNTSLSQIAADEEDDPRYWWREE